MCLEDKEIMQDLAYRGILKVRTAHNSPGLRTFKVSKFNVDAENYTDILSWRDCEITELPLILNILDEGLKAIVKSALDKCHNIKKIL